MVTSEASTGECLPVMDPAFSDEVFASPVALHVSTCVVFISVGLAE